jgi:hypothetical protein
MLCDTGKMWGIVMGEVRLRGGIAFFGSALMVDRVTELEATICMFY